MIINKKTKRCLEYQYAPDPLRRLAYGMLATVENMRKAGMIKPKPKYKNSAIDCEGCRAFLIVDSRVRVPQHCPKCGRHVSETARELLSAAARRGRPAASAHTQGFQRAKFHHVKKK